MGHPNLPDLGYAVDIPIKYTHNTGISDNLKKRDTISSTRSSKKEFTTFLIGKT
jgi:hypothetical protein